MAASVTAAERERLRPQAVELLELDERDTDAGRRVDLAEHAAPAPGELDVTLLQPTLGNAALARALAPAPLSATLAPTEAPTPEPTETPPPEAAAGPPAPPATEAVAPPAQAAPELEEPSVTAPEKAEAAKAEPERAEAATTEPDKAEAAKVEPKKAEAAAAQPAAAATAPGEAPAAPAPPPEQPSAVEAVPTAIAADASPGEIVHALADAAPSTAAEALAQAQAASGPALERQRTAAVEAIPELDAPTGLPPTEVQKPEAPPLQVAATPETSVTSAAPGAEETAAAGPVPEAPPVASRPTVLAGGGGGADQPAADQALSESAQAELDSVDLPADAVPTTLGERPTVDTSADTTQLATQEADAAGSVGGEAARAAARADRDFGENAIYPQPTNEVLRAQTEVKGQALPGVGPPGQLVLSPDVAAGLDASLKPVLADKLGAKAAEYDAGEERYQADATAAHDKARSDIADLEAQATEQQTAEQRKAKAEVAGQRSQWRREVDDVKKDFSKKSAAERASHEQKVGEAKRKGEADAAAAYQKAEADVAKEKADAEAKAAAKKREAEEESSGFWGWVKSKAKALIDAVKSAINFIYDKLRKLVKAAFELAKKVALAAIDFARNAINGLIKAFGAVLKTFVSIALAAFPEIAARINAKIDQAVDKAVAAVNAAADWLKKGVAAVLDFLASTIDSILGLIQSIYNGILTVVGMIISGEFFELMRRLGYLVDAAKTVPDVFEQAALEELLGTNLDEPLSPAELAQARKPPPGAEGGPTAGPMPAAPWTSENVGVDEVDQNFDLSPELAEDVLSKTGEDGSVEFGVSTDPARTMEAVIAEAGGAQTSEDVAAQKLPDDGLTPMDRAKVRWELMKTGIAKWWSDNWGKILLGAAAAILGFIALNIVTGGAITLAIGSIMGVIGPLFVGLTILKLAEYIKDYVQQAWNGDIRSGGKSLAKGLAAGAIELVSWLTFKAAGAAMKGAKALAKGVVRVAQKAASAVAKGFKFIVEKGKVLFQGVVRAAGKGLGKAAKKLTDLGEKLLEKLRFRKFRIRVARGRFAIEGWINPWVVIMEGPLKGEIREISQSEMATSKLVKGKEGILRAGKENVKVMLISAKKGFPRDDYREIYRLFTGISPKQLRKVVVHHVIERQTKKLFGAFKDVFLNAPRRLIAFEKGLINRIVHLSEIRVTWNRMYAVLLQGGYSDKAVAAALMSFSGYTERFIAHMERAVLQLRAAGKPVTEKALREAADAFRKTDSLKDAVDTATELAKKATSVP
jgi:hypothetical protein